MEEENKTKTNVPVKRKEEKTEPEDKVSTIRVKKIQEDTDLWNGVEEEYEEQKDEWFLIKENWDKYYANANSYEVCEDAKNRLD
jgi:hypothetical protein